MQQRGCPPAQCFCNFLSSGVVVGCRQTSGALFSLSPPSRRTLRPFRKCELPQGSVVSGFQSQVTNNHRDLITGVAILVLEGHADFKYAGKHCVVGVGGLQTTHTTEEGPRAGCQPTPPRQTNSLCLRLSLSLSRSLSLPAQILPIPSQCFVDI